VRQHGRHASEQRLNLPAEHGRARWTIAVVRHVHDIHARRVIQHFHREMRRRAGARRSIVELARLRFRERDEFLQVRGLHAGIEHEQVRRRSDERDRREILDRIVPELRVCGRRDHVRAGSAHREGVPVGRRARRDFGADGAARAAAIVDDHLLAERFGHALADEPRDDVGRSARRKRDDEADRFRRIRLLRRMRGVRGNAERQRRGGDANCDAHG
jgi:hypothetical protein